MFKGRHYSGIVAGWLGSAVIVGCGWAGQDELELMEERRSKVRPQPPHPSTGEVVNAVPGSA